MRLTLNRETVTLTLLIQIGAASISCQRQPPEPPSDTRGIVQPAARPVELTGFRSDAWFLPDDELLGFVKIPAGPFQMGSNPTTDPEAFDNELWPDRLGQATMNLPAFFVGRYEVTVAQFGAFVERTGIRVDEKSLQGPPHHPVTAVSWPDALAYCRWLETTMKQSSDTPSRLSQLLRNGWRVNLPSEAEWEKAARGTDGRLYPWGNVPRRDRANYEGTQTMPVGSFDCPECPFGLFDMSGNVWEWTRSPYQVYPYDPTDDRENLETDALWVMRGGSFADPARNVRAAIRGGGDPGVRRPFMGFRLVLSRL